MLADAAATIATQPVALQLRYLQTLTEIGVEKNTSIIFPFAAKGEAVLIGSFYAQGSCARA